MADDKVKEKSDLQVEVAPSGDGKAEVVAAGGGKVELDLDDAPFLREPEEKPLPPVERTSTAPAVVQEEPKSKKKFIIGGIAALMAVAAAVWWFVFRVPPPPVEPPKPEVIVVKPPEIPAADKDFVYELEPFWVPVRDDAGNTTFLVCRFSTIAKKEIINKEIEQQLMTVRDAMYYYLRNKTLDFLLEATNRETIKKDLTSVVNSYLIQGQVEDVLVESYLGH